VADEKQTKEQPAKAPKAAAAPPAAPKAAEERAPPAAPNLGGIEPITASPVTPKKGKKRVKKNIAAGIVHIASTFNNTMITITDQTGNVIAWSTAGARGFKAAASPRSLLLFPKEARGQAPFSLPLFPFPSRRRHPPSALSPFWPLAPSASSRLDRPMSVPLSQTDIAAHLNPSPPPPISLVFVSRRRCRPCSPSPFVVACVPEEPVHTRTRKGTSAGVILLWPLWLQAPSASSPLTAHVGSPLSNRHCRPFKPIPSPSNLPHFRLRAIAVAPVRRRRSSSRVCRRSRCALGRGRGLRPRPLLPLPRPEAGEITPAPSAF